MNHGNKSTFWAGALWAGISDTDNKTIMAALSKMLENPLVGKLLKIPLSSWSSTFWVIAAETEKLPERVVGMLRCPGMKHWGFLLPALLAGLGFCHGGCHPFYFSIEKCQVLSKTPGGCIGHAESSLVGHSPWAWCPHGSKAK